MYSHFATSALCVVSQKQDYLSTVMLHLRRDCGRIVCHDGGISFRGIRYVTPTIHPKRWLMISIVSSGYVPGITFCTPRGLSKNFYAFWIPVLVSESILCALALRRGFQSYSVRQGFLPSHQNLLNVLLKDSIVYFIM